MKKRLSSLYYIIPVVYVAVIGLFLYLQFGSGERFEETVGSATVSGRYSRGLTGGPRLRELEVRIGDLRLPIDSGSPILAGFGELRDKRILAVAYASHVDGFDVECQEGLLLRFELSGPRGQGLTVSPLIPAGLGTVSTLSLPFRLEDEQALETVPGIPLFTLAGRIGKWYVALPPGSSLDAERRRLIVRVPPGDAPAAVSFERLERPEEPYLYWFSREGPLGGTERYNEELGRFVDRAYRSWARLAAQEPGNPALAGELGVSLLAESVRRGEYRTMLALVSRSIRQILQDNPGAEIDYAGACYLGDLPSFLRRRQVQAAEETSLLTELIRRTERSLFATANLIPFIVNHAPLSLAEEVLRLADSVDLERETLFDVLNITGAYLDAALTLGLGDTAPLRVAAAVERRILPAIRAAGGGLYFVLEPQEQPTLVDLYASLQAGRVLQQAGRLLQRPAYEELGRNLVLSVLGQADTDGSLPAAGRVDPDGFTAGPARPAERLAPERIYRLVVERPYTPEEHPLYAYLNPGSWVLTASRLESVEIAAEQQRYLFSFPQGLTHYLLIQGVRPPQSLSMHGIPWRPDPQYFSYSDGWAYDEGTQSLYIKLTHRVEAEEIVVTY